MISYLRYSPRLMDVLMLSREEARRLGNDSIGPEHFVLAMIREGKGRAIIYLRNLGVDLNELKVNLEKETGIIKSSVSQTANLPTTPISLEGEKALMFTNRVALNFNSEYKETEHLLLSILKNEKCAATKILNKQGINFEIMEKQIEVSPNSDMKSNPVSTFNDSFIIDKLEGNREQFRLALSGLTKEEYTWKPLPEKWCLLEVVCHLHDEEREDFRARTKHTLEQPQNQLVKIDPVAWVTERKYMEQDYEYMLSQFLAERTASVKWLRNLKEPKWDNEVVHPKFGPHSAKLFLSNWLAHDYLHFRQILGLKHGFLQEQSGQDLGYAGKW